MITTVLSYSSPSEAQLRRWLTALAGAAAGASSAPLLGEAWTHNLFNGLLVGTLLALLDGLLLRVPYGAGLRRLPLPIYLPVLATLWTLLIITSLVFSHWLLLPDTAALLSWLSGPVFKWHVATCFGIALSITMFLRIGSLVGLRTLLKHVSGRYHRPVSESRIFMFLDIRGSTQLTEQLGDRRVAALISCFFFDLAAIVERHGGEIHRYIGDEMVATWPLDLKRPQSAHLDCLVAICHHTTEHSSHYLKRYGAVPRFTVGLHGGSVVVSEVGDFKREVVYFGDAINTAARLQQAAKARGALALSSQSLLVCSEIPEGLIVRNLPAVQLRGKNVPLAVAAVRPAGGSDHDGE